MAELEKIVFKNLPDETTPVSAENLNKFQDNIETVINEETTAMNNNADKKLEEVKANADTKLQDFDTASKQKLTDIQQQVDTTIEEMKGLVDVDKVEELQQRIETVESTALFYEVIEDLDTEVSADADAESEEPSIE